MSETKTRSTLTLQDAADELDVHYMTVYRYVRLGMLPARKVGVEWQITRSDFDAFRREKSEQPKRRKNVDWAGRLQQRLVAGDEPGAWGVVEAALAAGLSPEQVYLDVLGPAMKRIGDEWEQGTLDVADEHRGSAVAGRIVGRLGPRFLRRGRSKGTVVVAAPPGDLHSLPAAMVGDIFRSAGYDVLDLGANVPLSSLAKAAREANQLRAVAISASNPGSDEAVGGAIAAVREVVDDDVVILLGGGAIESADHAAALGADGFATRADEAVALLD